MYSLFGMPTLELYFCNNLGYNQRWVWVPWEFRHKEQVQAIFREWDTNCDGRLSIAEMARVLAEIGISQAWRVPCSTPMMPTADEIKETADVEC